MTDLLPCPFCGGEVRIVLFKDEFDCYWWAVARGADDETACHCRVFMECDRRWQVNEGDEPEDYPLASGLKRWLIEKWNTRTPEQARAADYWHRMFDAHMRECATLGSGECEMRESFEYVECKVQTFTCSACGWHGAIDDLFASDTIPNFCPCCGKAVKR